MALNFRFRHLLGLLRSRRAALETFTSDGRRPQARPRQRPTARPLLARLVPGWWPSGPLSDLDMAAVRSVLLRSDDILDQPNDVVPPGPQSLRMVEQHVRSWEPEPRYAVLGSIDRAEACAVLASELRALPLDGSKHLHAVARMIAIWEDERSDREVAGMDLADALERAAVDQQDSTLFPLCNAVRLLSMSMKMQRHGRDKPFHARKMSTIARVTRALMDCAEPVFQNPSVDKAFAGHLAWVCLGWATATMTAEMFVKASDDMNTSAHEIGRAVSRHRNVMLAALRLERRSAEDPYQNVMTMDDEFGFTPFIRRLRSTRTATVPFDETSDAAVPDADAVVSSEQVKSKAHPTIRVCYQQRFDRKIMEVAAGHEHVMTADVKLIRLPDLAAMRKILVFEFPYAVETVDMIFNDLVGRETVKINPTIIVGPPGSGKSRFIRRFSDLLGVHVWRVDAARSDSGVFGGTDRRWSSAEPCHPFLAISRARHGNPLILIEEIEKAASRNDNGRLWDSLLSFTEPETSARYPDPALQADLNLSEVSYVCTANDVDVLSSTFRDRFKAIAFPAPRARDIDALLLPIMADYVTQRRLDPAWTPPLSLIERDAIAERWDGGSVRKLTRFVHAVLRARERSAIKH